MAKNEDFITLKEAARISGYTPDYIGQLIRAGKLPGKQVFLNVAWMTTREAIEQYTSKDSKKSDGAFFGRDNPLISVESLSRLYEKIAWVGIGILGIFIVILFGILAVTIDRRIEQNYVDKLDQQGASGSGTFLNSKISPPSVGAIDGARTSQNAE